ncbi:MAG: ATP-grasp domain-containing protein [Legionellales bacterium]|nr:ATP-grasp domain-containing protein [Legionellales bacterium]
MTDYNIFLLSRNSWFLNFLRDEIQSDNFRGNNTLYIFNDAEVPTEIKQAFDSINFISSSLDYGNVSICFDEVSLKIDALLKNIPTKNIRIIAYNENLVYLAACLREKFNLTGLYADNALCFTNKVTMKKSLLNSSVKYPAYLSISKEFIQAEYQALPSLYETLLEKLHLPFVIKPDSLSGSRLLNIIRSYDDFFVYCNTIVLNNEINNLLAEQYIDGTLFHCDTLIDATGKILNFVSQYNYPMHYFLEGKAVGSWMIGQDSEDAIKIKDANKSVLTQFKAQKGIYHLEFFIDKKGEPVFLEAAARPAGGLILKMIKTCTGINLLKYDFLNWSVPDNITIRCYAGWAFIPFRDGVVENLDNLKLCSDYEIEWNIEIGKEYRKSQNLAEVAGKAFLISETSKKIMKDFLAV